MPKPQRTNYYQPNRVSQDSYIHKILLGTYELSPKRQALKITYIYFAIGSLWILLSDKLVEFLIKDESMILVISIVKGWIYVFITSVLIFSLVFTAMKKVTDTKDKIKKINDELEGKVLERTAQLEEINAMLEEEITEHQIVKEEIQALNEALENKIIKRTSQMQELNAILEEEITEKIQAENELKTEKYFTDAVIDSVPGFLYLYDEQGKLVRWNKKHEELTGYSSEELSNLTILDWYKEDEKSIQDITAGIRKTLEDGFGEAEANLQRKDGTIIPMYFTAVRLDLDGKTYFTGIGIDITDRKKKEDENLYLSYHDVLTGIYNRRFYEEEIKRLDTKRNLPISIIIGDVNGLKLVNDAFGHDKGDELLQKAATVIQSACRTDDIVARWGGDEFVILLPKTNTEEAEEIVDRIKELYSDVYVNAIRVSISFGWDTKRETDQDILKVLKSAEDYMYQHKIIENESLRDNTISTIIRTLH